MTGTIKTYGSAKAPMRSLNAFETLSPRIGEEDSNPFQAVDKSGKRASRPREKEQDHDEKDTSMKRLKKEKSEKTKAKKKPVSQSPDDSFWR